MTRWQPAPILGGAYTDEARPWAFQDTVNWLPVRIERPNGRSDWKLTPVPGTKVFSTLENGTTGSTDRVRGLRNVEGALYVVCGKSLFRQNTDGTVTTIQENAIPGSGRVTMTHNQETGGYSLVITNGYGGWTYNSGTSTFAAIDDEGFPGFKTCDFLDQYIVGISPDGLFAFHSDLANAGEYSTLDRYSAEAAPDRLVGQIADHGQWWLFGERTTEIYTNTGAATGTFQRIPGSTIERGLAGTHAVAKLDNTVFWVGNDGVVYRANGFTPVRISTHPIERELSQCDLSKAFCLVYEDRGHKILYVTCPDGKTWGYDVAAQEWHRRQSYKRSNWRINTLARWAGGWVGGDTLTNRLQRIAWEYRDEDGSPLVARRTTGILHGNENKIQVHAVRLVVDSGRIPGNPRPLEEPIYPVEIYNPLPSATVGTPVDHTYLGRFGVPPYTFSITAGALPAGLTMNSSGVISGTPTTAAAYAWRVQIRDSIGQTDTLDQGLDLAEGIDSGEGPFEVEPAVAWGMVYGDIYAIFSPEGLDWSGAVSPNFAPVSSLYAVSGNGLFITYDLGRSAVTANGGATWTLSAVSALGNSGGGRFGCFFPSNSKFYVAGGANGVYESSNGSAWTLRDSGQNSDSVGCSDTLLISMNGGASPTIRTSANGTTWAAATDPPLFPDATNSCRWASNGTRILLAGGSSSPGTSTLLTTTTDGNTWTANQTPFALAATFATACAYDEVNDKWIAGAATGEIAYSSTGQSGWTLSATNVGVRINDIQCSGGRCVLVGNGGEIFTSENGGVTWTDRGPTDAGVVDLLGVAPLI